ncbi:MAG: hypothetical protein GY841_14155 [FCB group bacterium]|nr:hypothetical protein [FCB group bacterium]
MYDLSIKNKDLLKKTQKLEKGHRLTLKQSLSVESTQLKQKQSYILADISGSMNGNKLKELKKALHTVWRSGIHGIAFGSQIYDFTQEDIDNLGVQGTTNMLGALEAAWEDSAEHIILLTDGYPDQVDSDILNRVYANKDIPIDTIGIGDSFNIDLLRKISKITNGKYNSVNEPLLLSEVMTELLQISENAGIIQL